MPMATTTADDPIREEVERVLHALVDATTIVPRAVLSVVTAVPRCVLRRACRLRRQLAEPVRIARSFLDLAGAGSARGVIEPDDAPVPGEAVVSGVAVDSRDGTALSSVARQRSALPIQEYESLAASQVVARLATLQPDELALVRDFESRASRSTDHPRQDRPTARMIDPVVRRAGLGDAGPLAVLEAEARASLVGSRGGDRWLDEHRLVGDAWADLVECTNVLVGELDVEDGELGLVVGYLVLDVEPRIARVTQVYVTPAAREVGFGDALIAAAMTIATDTGADVFEAEALPGDRETKNLYERAGITARLITVSRRLR